MGAIRRRARRARPVRGAAGGGGDDGVAVGYMYDLFTTSPLSLAPRIDIGCTLEDAVADGTKRSCDRIASRPLVNPTLRLP